MRITTLSDFQIAETHQFQKQKRNLDEKLLLKINRIVYPQLKQTPYFGTNIKKLKGDLQGYYRYRIGDYRLFYLIDKDKILVVITKLQHRQGLY
jgi:mRNA interferase RelE/StbE